MGDNKKNVYITMIRDPVDIFVSAWKYYKLGNGMSLGLKEVVFCVENIFPSF